MLLGDFNINILPYPSALLNCLLFLCLLNMSSNTHFNYTGSASLIGLNIISPTLYNFIHLFVHPDFSDSDHHPIIFLSFLPSSHIAPPCQVPCSSKASILLDSMPLVPNTSYEHFESVCTHTIADTSFTPLHGSHFCSPWLDNTCRKLLSLECKYLRLAQSQCSRSY